MLGLSLAACPKTPVTESAATSEAVQTPQVTTAEPLGDQNAITCQVPGLGDKVADYVLLYDPKFQLVDPGDFAIGINDLNRYVYGNGEMIPFSSWDSLVASIKEFCRIRHLTIFSHGQGGRLILTGVKDPLVLSDLVAKFGGVAPIIDELFFDGCNIGEVPAELATCMDAFQSSRIKAWNMYHYFDVIDFEVGTADTAESLDTSLLPLDYLVPGAPPPSSYVGQLGTYFATFEWFYADRSFPKVDQSTTPDKVPNRASNTPWEVNKRSAMDYQLGSVLPVSGLSLVTVTN